jgi:periplasmic protein TonB
MGPGAIAAGSPAPRRTDLRRVGPVVALVIAAHGLLLAIPRQAAIAAGAPTSASVQLRLIEVIAPQPVASPVPASIDDGEPDRVRQPSSVATPPSPERREKASEPMPAAPPLLVPQARTWLDMALPGVPTDDDLYLARALLSVVPAPIDAVVIGYPAFEGDAGRYVAELSLFIDETGSVVRVRVDRGPLPPALEDAARKAFVQARFRPGEHAEHGVVKSRIRVEVVFEGGMPLRLG